MMTLESKRKQLINFLMRRWHFLSNIAAIERVYLSSYKYAKENNQPIPDKPEFLIAQPCRQIEIIKNHIIDILPEAHFIDYSYEAPAPLDPNDFVEVFIADHHQCIRKVTQLMERMKVT